jgi:GT2 family glycosyltransferase
VISVYTKSRLNSVLSCIKSLKEQSLKPGEILVVLDPYPDLVDFYRSRLPSETKIVVSKVHGLSSARNAGALAGSGSIIAFIDDDAVADEHWLENLVRGYEEPSVAGVGGSIRPNWENQPPRWFPEELLWIIGCTYKGMPTMKCDVRNPIGCNMSFIKSIFGKVGYFRPDVGRFGKMLLAGEEAEFSIRIQNMIPESRIVYEPSAVVFHDVAENRASLRYIWKRSFYEGVSKALIQRLWHGHGSRTQLSTEQSYLKYLLAQAIPSRIARIYDPEALSQIMILFFSMSAVYAGYLIGRLR